MAEMANESAKAVESIETFEPVETGQSVETVEPEAVLDLAGEYIRDFDAEAYLPETTHPFFDLLSSFPLLLVLVVLGLGYAVGKFLQVTLVFVLKTVAHRADIEFDWKVLNQLLAPVLQTTVTLSLMVAVNALGLQELAEQIIIRLLATVLLLLWARAWFRVTRLILPVLSAEQGRFALLQPRTIPLFEIGIKLGLLSVFSWFFMVVWGIDGTAWLASAGVLGLAIGLAAQDTLANLISGVSIVADTPYQIGDYIVLDTGERGVVTGLGMRSTRLLTRDDVEISIPNAVMGNAKITNESGGPAVQQRIRVPVGVAYGTDVPLVISLLEEIVRENRLIIKYPAPRVRMRAFGESSLDFEVLGWIADPEQRGLATHELLMSINRTFREHEIVIPFPQRDLHIGAPAEQGAELSPVIEFPGTHQSER